MRRSQSPWGRGCRCGCTAFPVFGSSRTRCTGGLPTTATASAARRRTASRTRLPADDAECVVRQTDITIRRTVPDDLDDIGRIYAHHVQTGVATFELAAPDQTEWQHRLKSVTDRGLPFLTATLDGRIAGYAYCAPWKTRPAYRQTVEDSIYLAPDAV